MIAFEAAWKVFEARSGELTTAVADISLDIAKNEFVCLVGPSGCGKSTLLRLAAGLLLPDRGSVSIGGERVREPRSDTGIVFQSPTLLPWATILDNVLFPAKMMGVASPEIQERAKALLKLVGLEGLERRFPRELSGGMQQRAGICRALIHNPAVLLMDEPFGALDALTREELTIELLRIWTTQPKTILFVTHSIPEAVMLADRVVVMSAHPGRVAEVLRVDLPRPRSFQMESADEFHRCTQRVRQLIFGDRTLQAA
ncbi:MAG: transporter ATP-binding protein [Microvirga sp.]|jgi:NitT/TauT family transport system ATP-binding protein|nr:transporter ATP-binding protein [Microvirga sp.]